MAGKDRKKELARQRYERQQRRMAAQAARARRIKIAGSAAAVAVVAVGGVVVATVTGGDGKGKKANAEPTPKPGECAYKPWGEGDAKDAGIPPAKPAYPGTVQATIKTNVGTIKMDLDGARAPCTVNSFAYLAAKDFFDKTKCHRLVTGAGGLLQCGDPSGNGMGGPRYGFANEGTGNPQQMTKYPKAAVAMAHSRLPESNRSQFFMVYADSQLPNDYTTFGKITSGLDVLEKVGKAGSDPKGDGKPKKGVTIQDVSIAKK